jgi:HEAT repeat protein
LVESGNSDFAQAALTACAAITHSDAQQIVVEALESIDSDRQMQAIRAIKGRQQSYAAKVLRPFAVSYDERLAGEAIEALGQLRTDDAAEALIAAAAWPSRRERSVVALSHLGDAAVPALSRGLIRAELDTRRSIVEALSRIRTADAVAALESALEDPAAAVRHAALLALAHVKSPRHTGTSVTPRQGDN